MRKALRSTLLGAALLASLAGGTLVAHPAHAAITHDQTPNNTGCNLSNTGSNNVIALTCLLALIAINNLNVTVVNFPPPNVIGNPIGVQLAGKFKTSGGASPAFQLFITLRYDGSIFLRGLDFATGAPLATFPQALIATPPFPGQVLEMLGPNGFAPVPFDATQGGYVVTKPGVYEWVFTNPTTSH
jgi:hypothetical protein